MVMVNLTMRCRPVLVIGGGHVAEVRLHRLLAEGALVTVFSPELTEAIKTWQGGGRLRWIPEALSEDRVEELLSSRSWIFQEGDLESTNLGKADFLMSSIPLLMAATNKPDLNACINEWGRKKGYLLASVDGPGDLAFANESHWAGLRLALLTEPASPRLNALIRRDLERRYHSLSLEPVVADLGRLRQELKAILPSPAERTAFWRKELDDRALELIIHGQWNCVKKRLDDAISSLGIKS